MTSRLIETDRAEASARPKVADVVTHWIGGERLPSRTEGTFATYDPSTGAEITQVAAGGEADVKLAVAAARRTFEEGTWSGMKPRARAQALNRIADEIERRDDQIAELEALDTGLPITQAHGQARRAAENFRFFADQIVALHEEAFRVGDEFINYVLRKPVGVAGLITPWNTPFMLASWKLAPCLASGCTLVLKPAEWSPLSADVYASIFEAAELPAGAANIVQGIGEDAGEALVGERDVDLISFTGETTTGKRIMQRSADSLKRLSMELGGKSPVVIFADADLDRAIDAAIFGVFSLNGERCTAGSRVLVESSIYETVVERLAERASAIRHGDPQDPATEIGALIHREHYDRVVSYVEAGHDEGARLVAGGSRPAGLDPNGNFLAATVFADVTTDMRIFREEIFGPVLCATPFSDQADAIRLANAVDYGLAAYVWTSDLTRGHTVAGAIESGMAWINSQNVRDLRTPFGGIKNSGLGREGGSHSLDFYTEGQVVHTGLGTNDIPRFGAKEG